MREYKSLQKSSTWWLYFACVYAQTPKDTPILRNMFITLRVIEIRIPACYKITIMAQVRSKWGGGGTNISSILDTLSTKPRLSILNAKTFIRLIKYDEDQ